MKKYILLLSIAIVVISCKQEEKPKQRLQQQQADTVQVLQQQDIDSCDTIEPAHLYEELKAGKFVELILLNNGNGVIRQLGYDFAAEYCTKCNITIGKWHWQSEDLCEKWLTSLMVKSWYGKIDVKDFISYLDCGANKEKFAKQFPYRNKTKQQIKQYCRNVYMPNNTLDSCLKHGWFDYDALHFSFDGYDNPRDWTERYWSKCVDVEVVSWKQDKTLATDTSQTYFVIYKYKFHKSKREGNWGGCEITLRTKLTEYANGTFKIKDDDPNIYQSFDYDL